MNKQAFLDLLNNPEKISAKDLEGLGEVLENFPYFQAARILEAKGAKNLGKMLAEQKVRKAAAYSSDRSNLKKLLYPKPIQETKLPIPEVSSILEVTPLVVEETILQPDLILSNSDIQESLTTESTSPADWITGSFEEIKETASIRAIETNLPNNPILEELESNLKSLKELKARFVEQDQIQAPVKDQVSNNIISDQTINEIKENAFENLKTEIKKDVIIHPEKIKEHNHEDEIASSRLDEEIVSEETMDRTRAIDEKELLLNYLSFLESGKNKVKDKKKTEDIIDRFIKEDPSIPYLNKSNLQENSEDKASRSYKPKNNLVSENMAKILALQGKTDKAIEIYEQLVLKFPEKKAYFTSQIEKLNQK